MQRPRKKTPKSGPLPRVSNKYSSLEDVRRGRKNKEKVKNDASFCGWLFCRRRGSGKRTYKKRRRKRKTKRKRYKRKSRKKKRK